MGLIAYATNLRCSVFGYAVLKRRGDMDIIISKQSIILMKVKAQILQPSSIFITYDSWNCVIRDISSA